MFCRSRNKKQVTAHKLILMEMRMKAVCSQAFFNISLLLRERLLVLKRTHLWLDKAQKGFCMTRTEERLSSVADLAPLFKFMRLNETTTPLPPLCRDVSSVALPSLEEPMATFMSFSSSQDYILFTCTGISK